MKKYVNMEIVKAEFRASEDEHSAPLYEIHNEAGEPHWSDPEAFEKTHVELNEVHTEPLLQFFEYEHLPEKLQKISRPFGILAQIIVSTTDKNYMRTRALDNLILAKDAAVRAALNK